MEARAKFCAAAYTSDAVTGAMVDGLGCPPNARKEGAPMSTWLILVIVASVLVTLIAVGVAALWYRKILRKKSKAPDLIVETNVETKQ